jgi:protein MpaA
VISPLTHLSPLTRLPAAAGRRLRQRVTRLVLIAACGLPALGWTEKSPRNGAERPPAAPCDELAAHLPNVSAALCRDALLVPGPARSVKGRSILLRDMPNPEAKLRVLVLGGMHGDELSSTSVALHWLALAQNQPMDLAQPVHWRFIPALNPDGLTAQPPRRVNANGVDLNRNFPTPRWDREAPFYWEKRTRKDPRRWPGPRPLSEPESRYLHEEMARFKPHLIVSIHAPFGVLDFDGPSVPPARLGRLYLDQVGIYPGSLGNYGGVHKGVPVVTVELPNAQRTPLNAEMRQMWIDLLRWMSERVSQGLGEHPR